MDDVDLVLAYHRRTKHHPHRYARSLGYLDWETQPDPFLRFDGAPTTALSRGPFPPDPSFSTLDRPAELPGEPLDGDAIADLLFHAMAISAWKEFEGSRWSLRCNPSSGNLHPTETYVVAAGIRGEAEAGVFHYRPDEHALELRRAVDAEALRRLAGDRFLIGLTSIAWREAWKYGERAFRYVQHDVGHAIAAIAYAAAALGADVRAELGVGDAALARLLRTERATGPEAEHVDLLLSVGPAGRATPAVRLDANAVDALLRGDDLGTRSALSRDHHDWPVIEEVAEASRRDGALAGRPDPEPAGEPSASVGPAPSGPGRELLRRRRSAVAMDGRTPLARDAFLRMIGRLRPDPESTPWTAFPGRPAVHPFLFVHRVEGLASGLYVLVRDPAALDPLRAACAARFAWAPVDEALPSLLLLEEGDVRSIARSASCGQEIASDGAFAAAMVAEFAPRLRADGAWRYRALHWEAGAIGQVLYLEAEAAGVRATGIGCFFDDLTHGALGLRGDDHQVVYHFTVGGPVDDPRLVTRPAYP